MFPVDVMFEQDEHVGANGRGYQSIIRDGIAVYIVYLMIL